MGFRLVLIAVKYSSYSAHRISSLLHIHGCFSLNLEQSLGREFSNTFYETIPLADSHKHFFLKLLR